MLGRKKSEPQRITFELKNWGADQRSYLEYAQDCIDAVDDIKAKYENKGVIFSDEVKAILKKHNIRV